MEEVTKVIFDVWNRSQIVFGSVELVTLINVASGHDHNFFGSVELVTFILVTSGQLFNCYNLIYQRVTSSTLIFLGCDHFHPYKRVGRNSSQNYGQFHTLRKRKCDHFHRL